VLGVFTGEDILAAGLAPLPFTQMHPRPDGTPITAPLRHALTSGDVRFVGDPVALVIAETREIARDAADRIEIEWETSDAVADVCAAGERYGPVVWQPAFTAEHGNIAALYRKGDKAATDAAFAEAAHVTRLRVVNQRVVANPIEPRALCATFLADEGRFRLYCPTQNPHTVRNQLSQVFRLPESAFHVVCTDLGGGFGTRGYAYPEHAAICLAAREIGRPVRWRADRSENFLSEVHGRDSVTEAELALDRDHHFIGLRIRTIANVGAYLSHFGACVPALSGARAATGVYDIPNLDHEVRMLFTHTAPVDAYRGAGRPEIGYMMERLVSRASRELSVDAAALRMKNFVAPERMPYRNPAGAVCDCGNFPLIFQRALAIADWEGFPERKRRAADRGLLYGRAATCYVEVTGSARLTEAVELSFSADGTATLVSGTQQVGQGIQTSYSQILAERLGIAPEAVRIVQGDSDAAPTGGGAGASRSLQVGGSAAAMGADALVEIGRRLAAERLEAASTDVEYHAGAYRIAGTDRAVSLADLAATNPEKLLRVRHTETVQGMTWPNGCYVCEVEIDPQTGAVHVARFTSVDDIGTVVNPMIAEGQVHGGIAQGVGQALMERSAYDENGQLLSGSFMDYCMPRADLLPGLACTFDESVPSAMNRLGAKGVGEAGCHGAMPAVVEAVMDALGAPPTLALDMPLTPEKIWRVLAAKDGES